MIADHIRWDSLLTISNVWALDVDCWSFDCSLLIVGSAITDWAGLSNRNVHTNFRSFSITLCPREDFTATIQPIHSQHFAVRFGRMNEPGFGSAVCGDESKAIIIFQHQIGSTGSVSALNDDALNTSTFWLWLSPRNTIVDDRRYSRCDQEWHHCCHHWNRWCCCCRCYFRHMSRPRTQVIASFVIS